jgi:hypothetical protein
MTHRSRTLKGLMIGLAVLAIGASSASATPLTYQERQALAARGQGAPTPPVVIANHPGGRLAVASTSAPKPATTQSSDGSNWGAIAAFAAAALAACVAILAVGRRHYAATPR